MTQSRRKANPKPKPDPEPEVAKFAAVAGPMFLATENLPALGLSAATAAEVLADAVLVDGWLTQEATWRAHSELVAKAGASWGERPVDRLNAALTFLERSGRVVRV